MSISHKLVYVDIFCGLVYFSENFLQTLVCVLLFFPTGTWGPMKTGSKVPPKI